MVLFRFEYIYTDQQYVMYEGLYNYTQAAAKCAEEGATLAMATDKDTFDLLYYLVDVYTMQGGPIVGAFLDGSRQTRLDEWFCTNVQDVCPATMPWQPGQPDHPNSQHCVAIFPPYARGVDNSYCSRQKMTMCKF